MCKSKLKLNDCFADWRMSWHQREMASPAAKRKRTDAAEDQTDGVSQFSNIFISGIGNDLHVFLHHIVVYNNKLQRMSVTCMCSVHVHVYVLSILYFQ